MEPTLTHDLSLIRRQSPLVLNLTNLVAMDLTANALLALGASPVMSSEPEETDELVAAASALNVNLGTLTCAQVRHMEHALERAADRRLPVALDPVGAGATGIRTRTASRLASHPAITVVRGNASEMAAIRGAAGTAKGVDSTVSAPSEARALREYSRGRSTVYAMSGEIDFVIRDGQELSVSHGHPTMARVTAMGCTATALVAAFLAVSADPVRASLHAMLTMGLCGEWAARGANGPGTFRARFIDALAAAEDIAAGTELRVAAS